MRKNSIGILGILALLAGSAAATSAQAAPASPTAAGVAFAAPDNALGDDWQTSSDTAVAGVGDTDGFHLYVAREAAAFRWTPLATLRASGTDLGAWTGYVCTTGSGRYAVAVYAPVIATNRPAATMAGAFASVVDLATGTARHLVTGVQLAYFNPACGPSDRVLLTRAVGREGERTDLLAVDAVTAEVESTRRIDRQLTTPTPAPDGDYGIAGGRLVKVGATGRLTAVATPAGQPFAVEATSGGAVDLVSVRGEQAVAQRWQGGRLTRTGTGPRQRLQLFRGAGGNRLVGDVTKVRSGVPGLSTLRAERPVRAVSAQGHLMVERVAPTDKAVELTTRAAHSGREINGSISAGGGPTLSVPLPGRPAAKAGPAVRAGPAARLAEDAPACAVPRNNPSVQPLQPSYNMVEWAVEQAVHGQLLVQRPANYLKTGLNAYQPQVRFPPHQVAYGGTVPSQLMMAILSQETNMAQASWHGVPGDTANPLVSDYYGNRDANGNSNIEVIDYTKSDCGYGIGQVTTGMRAGETVFTPEDKVRIAVDYAANIAAAMNILIDKWNQLNQDSGGRNKLNDGDPRYIENWYAAVWAYNSGFYPYAERASHGGNWGVGWFNNPVNPRLPANRPRFLADPDDASHPGDWTYPELIMGWAETPQWYWLGNERLFKYSKPAFGSSGKLILPNIYSFCTSAKCVEGLPANPCPDRNENCWWHGETFWAICSSACATERLTYPLGSAERPLQRSYGTDCGNFTGDREPRKIGPPLIVYTLNETGQYNLGCPIGPSDGKFTLRLGNPAGGYANPVDPTWRFAQIDLHQLGAGHKGHMWFTHVYKPDYPDGDSNAKHQIVATWSPDLPYPDDTRYDIVAHLPSHGGEWDTSRYYIWPDPKGVVPKICSIDQSTNGADRWKYLGNLPLKKGARVQLKNVAAGAQGNIDIAFDAVAFIPTGTTDAQVCNADY
ncbi:hypothetical protein GCM10020358_53980 [Amorphoplanes nipponensis]|uniref:Transglycosylase SLT domain-containing protein n=2 Tax=Actinoplanes nipponensis TaxID=135950 RepID=A0A919MIX0_9ACTN|nr:hypothetical protein Ani05nite_47330 [Actinoplanes nipponensis]